VWACFMLARERTPSSPGREREKEGGRERERERESEKEGERERCRICPDLLFLFFKGMTGALAPFSYLIMLYYVAIVIVLLHVVIMNSIISYFYNEWISAEGSYAECRYGRYGAECQDLFIVMLNVIVLSVVRLGRSSY
jgi:hypothetical protein